MSIVINHIDTQGGEHTNKGFIDIDKIPVKSLDTRQKDCQTTTQIDRIPNRLIDNRHALSLVFKIQTEKHNRLRELFN